MPFRIFKYFKGKGYIPCYLFEQCNIILAEIMRFPCVEVERTYNVVPFFYREYNERSYVMFFNIMLPAFYFMGLFNIVTEKILACS